MRIHFDGEQYAGRDKVESSQGRIAAILATRGDEVALCAALRRDMGLWRHDETPDLKYWCEVLDLLDSTLIALMCKYEEALFVPVHCIPKINGLVLEQEYHRRYTVEMRTNPCDFRAKLTPEAAHRAAARVSPNIAAATAVEIKHEQQDEDSSSSSKGKGTADAVIAGILTWLVSMLRPSVNRQLFASMDLVLGCLRAYDDEVGHAALELSAEMVLEPYNHRGLCFYDCVPQLEQCNETLTEPLMDIVAAADCGSGGGAGLVHGATLSTSVEDMRKLLPSTATTATTSTSGGGGELWRRAHTDLAAAKHRPAADWQVDCHVRSCLDGVDLGADGFSLRDAMLQLCSGSGAAKATAKGVEDGHVRDHAVMLLWRLRFQRRQAVAALALAAGDAVACHTLLSSVVEQTLMAHTAVIRGHPDEEAINSFYLHKRGVVGDLLHVLNSASVHLSTTPSSSSHSSEIKAATPMPSLAVAQWAACAVWAVLMRTVEVTEDDEDNSSLRSEPERDVMECFADMLAHLGLGKEESSRSGSGLPALLRRSMRYLCKHTIQRASVEGETFQGSSQVLCLIERLLWTMTRALHIPKAAVRMVSEGLLETMLQAMSQPLMRGVAGTDSIDSTGGGTDPLLAGYCHTLPLSRYQTLRVSVDSFICQILDVLMGNSKFALETYRSLKGDTTIVRRLYHEAALLESAQEACPAGNEEETKARYLSLHSLVLSLTNNVIAFFTVPNYAAAATTLLRTPEFTLTLRRILQCGAGKESAMHSTIVTLLGTALQSDPAPPGVLNHLLKESDGGGDSLLDLVWTLFTDGPHPIYDSLERLLDLLGNMLFHEKGRDFIMNRGMVTALFGLFVNPLRAGSGRLGFSKNEFSEPDLSIIHNRAVHKHCASSLGRLVEEYPDVFLSQVASGLVGAFVEIRECMASPYPGQAPGPGLNRVDGNDDVLDELYGADRHGTAFDGRVHLVFSALCTMLLGLQESCKGFNLALLKATPGTERPLWWLLGAVKSCWGSSRHFLLQHAKFSTLNTAFSPIDDMDPALIEVMKFLLRACQDTKTEIPSSLDAARYRSADITLCENTKHTVASSVQSWLSDLCTKETAQLPVLLGECTSSWAQLAGVKDMSGIDRYGLLATVSDSPRALCGLYDQTNNNNNRKYSCLFTRHNGSGSGSDSEEASSRALTEQYVRLLRSCVLINLVYTTLQAATINGPGNEAFGGDVIEAPIDKLSVDTVLALAKNSAQLLHIVCPTIRALLAASTRQREKELEEEEEEEEGGRVVYRLALFSSMRGKWEPRATPYSPNTTLLYPGGRLNASSVENCSVDAYSCLAVTHADDSSSDAITSYQLGNGVWLLPGHVHEDNGGAAQGLGTQYVALTGLRWLKSSDIPEEAPGDHKQHHYSVHEQLATGPSARQAGVFVLSKLLQSLTSYQGAVRDICLVRLQRGMGELIWKRLSAPSPRSNGLLNTNSFPKIVKSQPRPAYEGFRSLLAGSESVVRGLLDQLPKPSSASGGGGGSGSADTSMGPLWLAETRAQVVRVAHSYLFSDRGAPPKAAPFTYFGGPCSSNYSGTLTAEQCKLEMPGGSAQVNELALLSMLYGGHAPASSASNSPDADASSVSTLGRVVSVCFDLIQSAVTPTAPSSGEEVARSCAIGCLDVVLLLLHSLVQYCSSTYPLGDSSAEAVGFERWYHQLVMSMPLPYLRKLCGLGSDNDRNNDEGSSSGTSSAQGYLEEPLDRRCVVCLPRVRVLLLTQVVGRCLRPLLSLQHLSCLPSAALGQLMVVCSHASSLARDTAACGMSRVLDREWADDGRWLVEVTENEQETALISSLFEGYSDDDGLRSGNDPAVSDAYAAHALSESSVLKEESLLGLQARGLVTEEKASKTTRELTDDELNPINGEPYSNKWWSKVCFKCGASDHNSKNCPIAMKDCTNAQKMAGAFMKRRFQGWNEVKRYRKDNDNRPPPGSMYRTQAEKEQLLNDSVRPSNGGRPVPYKDQDVSCRGYSLAAELLPAGIPVSILSTVAEADPAKTTSVKEVRQTWERVERECRDPARWVPGNSSDEDDDVGKQVTSRLAELSLYKDNLRALALFGLSDFRCFLVNLTSHVSPAPSEMLRYKIGGAYSEAHQHYNSDREGVALGNPDDDDDDEKKDGDTDPHTTTCGFGGPAPALLSFRCMGATVGEGEGRGKGANSDDRLVHLLTRMGAGIANCLPNTSLAPSAWVKGQITQDRSRWGLCDSVNNYESQQRGMRAVVVMLTWLIDLVLTESPLTLNGGGRSGSSRDCQESSLAGAGAGAYSADSPDRVASALRLVHLLLSVGINNGTFRVQPDTESFYMHADCLPALLTMHPRLSAFIPWIRACALGSSNSSGNIHHPHRHRQLLSSIIMSGLSRTFLWDTGHVSVAVALAAVIPGALEIASSSPKGTSYSSGRCSSSGQFSAAVGAAGVAGNDDDAAKLAEAMKGTHWNNTCFRCGLKNHPTSTCSIGSSELTKKHKGNARRRQREFDAWKATCPLLCAPAPLSDTETFYQRLSSPDNGTSNDSDGGGCMGVVLEYFPVEVNHNALYSPEGDAIGRAWSMSAPFKMKNMGNEHSTARGVSLWDSKSKVGWNDFSQDNPFSSRDHCFTDKHRNIMGALLGIPLGDGSKTSEEKGQERKDEKVGGGKGKQTRAGGDSLSSSHPPGSVAACFAPRHLLSAEQVRSLCSIVSSQAHELLSFQGHVQQMNPKQQQPPQQNERPAFEIVEQGLLASLTLLVTHLHLRESLDHASLTEVESLTKTLLNLPTVARHSTDNHLGHGGVFSLVASLTQAVQRLECKQSCVVVATSHPMESDLALDPLAVSMTTLVLTALLNMHHQMLPAHFFGAESKNTSPSSIFGSTSDEFSSKYPWNKFDQAQKTLESLDSVASVVAQAAQRDPALFWRVMQQPCVQSVLFEHAAEYRNPGQIDPRTVQRSQGMRGFSATCLNLGSQTGVADVKEREEELRMSRLASPEQLSAQDVSQYESFRKINPIPEKAGLSAHHKHGEWAVQLHTARKTLLVLLQTLQLESTQVWSQQTAILLPAPAAGAATDTDTAGSDDRRRCNAVKTVASTLEESIYSDIRAFSAAAASDDADDFAATDSMLACRVVQFTDLLATLPLAQGDSLLMGSSQADSDETSYVVIRLLRACTLPVPDTLLSSSSSSSSTAAGTSYCKMSARVAASKSNLAVTTLIAVLCALHARGPGASWGAPAGNKPGNNEDKAANSNIYSSSPPVVHAIASELCDYLSCARSLPPPPSSTSGRHRQRPQEEAKPQLPLEQRSHMLCVVSALLLNLRHADEALCHGRYSLPSGVTLDCTLLIHAGLAHELGRTQSVILHLSHTGAAVAAAAAAAAAADAATDARRLLPMSLLRTTMSLSSQALLLFSTTLGLHSVRQHKLREFLRVFDDVYRMPYDELLKPPAAAAASEGYVSVAQLASGSNDDGEKEKNEKREQRYRRAHNMAETSDSRSGGAGANTSSTAVDNSFHTGITPQAERTANGASTYGNPTAIPRTSLELENRQSNNSGSDSDRDDDSDSRDSFSRCLLGGGLFSPLSLPATSAEGSGNDDDMDLFDDGEESYDLYHDEMDDDDMFTSDDTHDSEYPSGEDSYEESSDDEEEEEEEEEGAWNSRTSGFRGGRAGGPRAPANRVGGGGNGVPSPTGRRLRRIAPVAITAMGGSNQSPWRRRVASDDHEYGEMGDRPTDRHSLRFHRHDADSSPGGNGNHHDSDDDNYSEHRSGRLHTGRRAVPRVESDGDEYTDDESGDEYDDDDDDDDASLISNTTAETDADSVFTGAPESAHVVCQSLHRPPAGSISLHAYRPVDIWRPAYHPPPSAPWVQGAASDVIQVDTAGNDRFTRIMFNVYSMDYHGRGEGIRRTGRSVYRVHDPYTRNLPLPASTPQGDALAYSQYDWRAKLSGYHHVADATVGLSYSHSGGTDLNCIPWEFYRETQLWQPAMWSPAGTAASRLNSRPWYAAPTKHVVAEYLAEWLLMGGCGPYSNCRLDSKVLPNTTNRPPTLLPVMSRMLMKLDTKEKGKKGNKKEPSQAVQNKAATAFYRAAERMGTPLQFPGATDITRRRAFLMGSGLYSMSLLALQPSSSDSDTRGSDDPENPQMLSELKEMMGSKLSSSSFARVASSSSLPPGDAELLLEQLDLLLSLKGIHYDTEGANNAYWGRLFAISPKLLFTPGHALPSPVPANIDHIKKELEKKGPVVPNPTLALTAEEQWQFSDGFTALLFDAIVCLLSPDRRSLDRALRACMIASTPNWPHRLVSPMMGPEATYRDCLGFSAQWMNMTGKATVPARERFVNGMSWGDATGPSLKIAKGFLKLAYDTVLRCSPPLLASDIPTLRQSQPSATANIPAGLTGTGTYAILLITLRLLGRVDDSRFGGEYDEVPDPLTKRARETRDGVYQCHYWDIARSAVHDTAEHEPKISGTQHGEGSLWHLIVVRNKGLLRLVVNLLCHALPVSAPTSALSSIEGDGDVLEHTLKVLWRVLKRDYVAFWGGYLAWEDMDQRGFDSNTLNELEKNQVTKTDLWGRNEGRLWQQRGVLTDCEMTQLLSEYAGLMPPPVETAGTGGDIDLQVLEQGSAVALASSYHVYTSQHRHINETKMKEDNIRGGLRGPVDSWTPRANTAMEWRIHDRWWNPTHVFSDCALTMAQQPAAAAAAAEADAQLHALFWSEQCKAANIMDMNFVEWLGLKLPLPDSYTTPYGDFANAGLLSLFPDMARLRGPIGSIPEGTDSVERAVTLYVWYCNSIHATRRRTISPATVSTVGEYDYTRRNDESAATGDTSAAGGGSGETSAMGNSISAPLLGSARWSMTGRKTSTAMAVPADESDRDDFVTMGTLMGDYFERRDAAMYHNLLDGAQQLYLRPDLEPALCGRVNKILSFFFTPRTPHFPPASVGATQPIVEMLLDTVENVMVGVEASMHAARTALAARVSSSRGSLLSGTGGKRDGGEEAGEEDDIVVLKPDSELRLRHLIVLFLSSMQQGQTRDAGYPPLSQDAVDSLKVRVRGLLQSPAWTLLAECLTLGRKLKPPTSASGEVEPGIESALSNIASSTDNENDGSSNTDAATEPSASAAAASISTTNASATKDALGQAALAATGRRAGYAVNPLLLRFFPSIECFFSVVAAVQPGELSWPAPEHRPAWAGGTMIPPEYYDLVHYVPQSRTTSHTPAATPMTLAERPAASGAGTQEDTPAASTATITGNILRSASGPIRSNSSPRSPRRVFDPAPAQSDEVFFQAPLLERVHSLGSSSNAAAATTPGPTTDPASQLLPPPSVLSRQYSMPSARFHADESGGGSITQRCLQDRDLASLLSRFCQDNRLLFNMKLSKEIRLLEGPLLPLLMLPECRKSLDLRVRMKYFDLCLSRLEELPDEYGEVQDDDEPIHICVNRETVLEDTVAAFRDLTPHDLMSKDIDIEFEGEDGIDASGLTREWYMLVCRAIFKAEYGLFTKASDGVTYMPNSNSTIHENGHLEYFLFVGRLLGRALFDQQPLDVHFTRSFYKHILGHSVTFADLEAFDPGFFKNLSVILESPLEDLGLELTFEVENNSFGEVVSMELLPDGANIPVTDSNKTEYVRLVAHHRMTASVRQQLDAFLEGFHSLIPADLISIFDAQELELLTCGMPEVDVEDMERNTTYVNYERTSDPIVWLWSMLKGFTQEERAKFVAFVTGSSKVPLEGFKALRGQEGAIARLSVHRSYNNDGLPCAHTCFNQLDLPNYPSEEVMREKLLLALREGGEGFGLA